MKKLVVLALAVGSWVLVAAENPCPQGMEGTLKIAVTYQPAGNWKDFSRFVGGHLSFLQGQMRSGNLQYAGPFLDGSEVDGGLSVYHLTDSETVKQVIAQDPLIANGVATARVQPWLECQLATP